MSKTGRKWISCDFASGTTNCSQTHNKSVGTNDQSKTENYLKREKDHTEHVTTLPTPRHRTFNFEQNLVPQTVADLAVHPKKIKEVDNWLTNTISTAKNRKSAAFLLITGPAGSGKSVTVKVLSKSLNINITEWVNPVDHNFETFRGSGQIVRFREFLTESKWKSLFASTHEKVILVEDFPNALIRNPEDFFTILEDCYATSNYSVIFVCTDSFDNGSNISQLLFPDNIIAKFGIAQISFNPCAATLLKNALKRAHNLVQKHKDLFKIPSATVVDAIISTSMGDIRSATNQYYLASLLDTGDLPVIFTKSQEHPNSKKRKRGGTASLKCSRDENLGLFHGLGRVLNPKKIEDGGKLRVNCNYDKLVNEFDTQPGVFVSFLFENYIKYFGNLQDMEKASEMLSLSQEFINRFDRHECLVYAMWLSVMGLMLSNQHKLSKWNQIKGPRKMIITVNSEAPTSLCVADMYYYNLITKNVSK